jgi:hypothetical protein
VDWLVAAAVKVKAGFAAPWLVKEKENSAHGTSKAKSISVSKLNFVHLKSQVKFVLFMT